MRHITRALLVAGVIGLPAMTTSALAADAAPASPHTLTSNIGIFSQYVFRGLTQTNEKPAMQGGFDYAHSSGLYAGVWGSNVSWISDTVGQQNVSASLELDTYGGYKGAFSGGDVSYDVGFLRYNYPGDYTQLPTTAAKPDTNEVYGALSYKWFTAKYSYSLGNTFGVKDARGSDYIDLSANFEIADALTLGLHAGKQKFKGTNAAAWAGTVCTNDCYSYTDYKVSLTKAIKDYSVGIAFTGTNAKGTASDGTVVWNNRFGKNVGRSEATVFVSRTF